MTYLEFCLIFALFPPYVIKGNFFSHVNADIHIEFGMLYKTDSATFAYFLKKLREKTFSLKMSYFT